MKLAAIHTAEGPRLATRRDATWHALPVPAGTDVADLLRSGHDIAELVAGASSEPLPEPQRFAAPVRRPGKVVAIGLNYLDHIRESGVEPPERPLVFAKFPSAIVGPDEPIALNPAVAERVDWEGELAVVVGTTLRDAEPSEALAGVFGYTIANDVSARDVQFADGQWIRGKNLDSFCPVGPIVVTGDEVGDPQALRITTTVSGETMQDASTGEMVFGVAELLSFCSHSFTFEPGDLVLTGTPWGCGEFMEPQRLLRSGDVVEIRIEPIGTLRNPVA